MTKSIKRICIDITDLLAWRGHLTGIQRVVYETSKRFNHSKDDLNVLFFSYNGSTHQFYQADFDSLAARIEMEQSEVLHEEIADNNLASKHLKVIAKNLYFRLPYEVRNKITPGHKQLASKTYHKLRLAASKTKNISIRISGTNKLGVQANTIDFNADDHILILGKPWDDMRFIEDLRKIKVKTNLKITHLIYDMIPTFLPHSFGKPLPTNYTNYMFDALSLSDSAVAISKSSKKDAQKFCKLQNIDTPNIDVTRLGDSFMPLSEDIESKNKLIEEPFILCVGTVEARKNHNLLYTAYKNGLERGLDLPKLVIVGGIGWYTSDFMYMAQNDPQTKDKIIFMHKINDHNLDWLYKNCLFSVYPSIYEGWGLPIAESLGYGKVCIASNSSSMTEIAGDLIDYFSPYDPAACTNLIEQYLNPKHREDKEKTIKLNYRPTSWDKCYNDVRTAIKSAD